MVASWTYRARRQAGLCGMCGEKPLPGGASCASCRDKMRQHKRRTKGRAKPPRRVEHLVTAPAPSAPSEPTPTPEELDPEGLEIQALTNALIGTMAEQLDPAGKEAKVVITSAGLFLDLVFALIEMRDPEYGFGLSREVIGKLIRERRLRLRDYQQGLPDEPKAPSPPRAGP